MADFTVVREDGDGEQTILTLRVSDHVWDGRCTRVEVVALRKVVLAERCPLPIPQQRVSLRAVRS